MNTEPMSLLKLTVRNHPGVLAHVCGLFTRRAYNLEGVMVHPMTEASDNISRMWLLVKEEARLQQVMRQTEKLIDVISVEQHTLEDNVFNHSQQYFV